jgi:predicted nucleic acid-binding protein
MTDLQSACLLDTSILMRLTDTEDVAHPTAANAIQALTERGVTLVLAPQVLIEFRAAATRPVEANGLGLHPDDVTRRATRFETLFTLLEDTADIYPAWKRIVQEAGVAGKQVHDARLAAVCHAHAVPSVLTFNTGHFTRFMGIGPGVTVLDPRTL